jgi:hypothetical protein
LVNNATCKNLPPFDVLETIRSVVEYKVITGVAMKGCLLAHTLVQRKFRRNEFFQKNREDAYQASRLAGDCEQKYYGSPPPPHLN